MMDVRTDVKAMDVEFFVGKVRELFDVSKKVELAEKVLQEVFDASPHYWGVREEGIYQKCKRAYAKYVYHPDDELFIGEDNEGISYYVDFIEFEVKELDPNDFYFENWHGERIFDKHPKVIFELWKDIEAYGMMWRLSVRVELRSEKDNDNEEDGFEEALAKYQKKNPEFIEWLKEICETDRLIV
jgi:hypothetical protein